MLADLTMIATLPVDESAVQKATEEGEVQAQQPEIPHPIPGLPKAPEQPVVPPDDPHRHGRRSRTEHRSAADRTAGARRRRKNPASPSHRAHARETTMTMTRACGRPPLLAIGIDRGRVRSHRNAARAGHDVVAGRLVDRALIGRRASQRDDALVRVRATPCRPAPTSIYSPAICFSSTASASRPSRRIAPSTASATRLRSAPRA